MVAGSYQLTAVATVPDGSVTTSPAVGITVRNVDLQSPTAPTNVTSSGITTNSFVLSWVASTDNVGVTGYNVFINGVMTGGVVTTTSLSLTGLSASTSYAVTVKARDAAGNTSAASATLDVKTTSPADGTGTIIREFWNNVTGGSVADIPLAQPVSGTAVLTSLEGPTNWSDNYGDRIRGYVIPSTTGAYTFYVAGDDNTELYLSTNDNPASKTRIAFVSGWSNPREWNRETSQQSVVINLVAGQRYYVEILHKEGGGGDNVAVGWTGPGIPTITVIGGANIAPFVITTPVTPPPVVTGTGTIIREFWTGVSGTSVSNIPLTQPVSGTAVLTTLEGPTNWADDYGDRIRGYVIPSTTGAYTFYVAGDDNTELYLSTNDNPANKTRIAFMSGWSNPREWNRETSQQSAVINLVAGQRYYVEILHKEGGGGDNVAVGWTGPGIATITVIGGANIAPFVITAPVTPPPVVTGRIIREFWNNVTGQSVSDIPLAQPVSGTAVLTSLEGPTNWADDYGDRIRGYVIPSTTGAYTFYVAGDNNAELYLSTNDNPASKTRIAFISGWSNPREWNRETSQQSGVINLVAGQRYYVEILHKEGGGGDNVAVGWTGPGIATITVIGGVNIAPFVVSGGARLAAMSELTVRVYPNPVGEEFMVSGLAETSTLEIVSQDGRVLKRHEQVADQSRVATGELRTGLYLVRITNSLQGVVTQKIIKQ